MAPLSTTRTLFELRVGSAHTLEVLLQIRLQDISWWNDNLHDHECQLYKLIGRRVLPNDDACRTEIEADRARAREANESQGGLKKAAQSKTSNTGRKRRGTEKKNGGVGDSTTQKRRKNAKDGKNEAEETKLKLLRDTSGTWMMGKSIQICKRRKQERVLKFSFAENSDQLIVSLLPRATGYKMEIIDTSNEETLFFRPKGTINSDLGPDGNATKGGSTQSSVNERSQTSKKVGVEGNNVKDDEKIIPLASFRTWKKLPKRMNVWVFKFNPNDPTDLSLSQGGGFPRPELLPMADIFRSFGE